ncbi:MAG: deoxyribonuclease IV [Calditerrivibrio sp.]|nr:deoxyribonuclease IV [Calditerrivibrio sp.]
MIIGAHESIAGGLEKSLERGFNDGAEAVQIFVKSSNRWKDKPLSDDSIKKFFDASKIFNIPLNRIVVHSSYLINMASEGETYEKSFESMEDELSRCERLGIMYYVIHPGSHLGSGEDIGLDRIVKFIDDMYSKNMFKTKTLLETTAGQGSNLGYKLEHLSYIIDKSRYSDKLSICIDTCHLYSAGYDILDDYENMMEKIFEMFGDKLEVVHINDTKKALGSRVDRHELLGKGYFGLDFFKRILNDKRFENIIGILETPVTESYRDEIQILKNLK